MARFIRCSENGVSSRHPVSKLETIRNTSKYSDEDFELIMFGREKTPCVGCDTRYWPPENGKWLIHSPFFGKKIEVNSDCCVNCAHAKVHRKDMGVSYGSESQVCEACNQEYLPPSDGKWQIYSWYLKITMKISSDCCLDCSYKEMEERNSDALKYDRYRDSW